jgi:RNA polymerase sigma-70 factor (ECF subfamily)
MEEAPQPGAWVEQHANAMYRFAILQVRDRDLAEDLVHEAIAAALAARSGFREASSERTWLISILRHKIVDHFRRRGRETPVDTSSAEAVEAMFDRGKWRSPPDAWPAGEVMDRGELHERLTRCLGRLPAELGDAVCLREIHDIPTAEICEIMGISATNLSTRLYRARALLRACLEQHGDT